MAFTALRLEVSRSGLRIANEDIQDDGRTRRRGALSWSFREHAPNKCGDGLHVIIGHVDRRHPLIFAGAVNDRSQQLAILIVQHELPSKEIGPAHFATAKIGAVAASALEAVDLATARDKGGIVRIALLRGKARDAAPAAGRRRSGRLRRQSDERCANNGSRCQYRSHLLPRSLRNLSIMGLTLS
jgi:hypothetical protein